MNSSTALLSGRRDVPPDIALVEPWLPEDGKGFADPLVIVEEPESSLSEAEPFSALTHSQVLALEFEEERFLIEHLIPAGAVGTIAGVPETHKSFLAQAIHVRCGGGAGEIFGCQVAGKIRSGYFWQDDSRREEAERVKFYESVHAAAEGAALWWFLNPGIALPEDIGRLRATVERYRLELLILDSFYSVVHGIDLRDKEAEQIILLLKRDIADPTGCTVLIVDHMPWATDTNRSRLRGYGGVHKGAAIRFGIYIDAEGKKLYVEARGNNIKGFKKTPAYWDADNLELRLVDPVQVDHDELDQRVLAYVTGHPGATSKSVEDDVDGGRESIRKALERLASNELVAKGPGRRPRGNYWYPANHAALQSPGDNQATLGDISPGLSQGQLSPESPAPRRGGDSAGDYMDCGENGTRDGCGRVPRRLRKRAARED
jgi:AAA domain